jgi:hypothetical protein
VKNLNYWSDLNPISGYVSTTIQGLVRLTGIEPVTPSFGNWYSIQTYN